MDARDADAIVTLARLARQGDAVGFDAADVRTINEAIESSLRLVECARESEVSQQVAIVDAMRARRACRSATLETLCTTTRLHTSSDPSLRKLSTYLGARQRELAEQAAYLERAFGIPTGMDNTRVVPTRESGHGATRRGFEHRDDDDDDDNDHRVDDAGKDNRNRRRHRRRSHNDRVDDYDSDSDDDDTVESEAVDSDTADSEAADSDTADSEDAPPAMQPTLVKSRTQPSMQPPQRAHYRETTKAEVVMAAAVDALVGPHGGTRVHPLEV